MTEEAVWIIWMAMAYALGSIPTAVWLSALWFRKDVRTGGSGNAGATNMMRQFGKKAGLVVLVIDIAKGLAAVSLPFAFGSTWPQSWTLVSPEWPLALLAALGHIFPVWAGFKGGKAVATLLGAMLGVSPLSAGIALAIFALVLAISRMVSLAALVAAFGFAAASFFTFPEASFADRVFIVLLPLLLCWTHRSNLIRIWRGEESKIGEKSNNNSL